MPFPSPSDLPNPGLLDCRQILHLSRFRCIKNMYEYLSPKPIRQALKNPVWELFSSTQGGLLLPHPRMVPAVGRMKRRANLHVDSSYHCQFISHSTSSPGAPNLHVTQSYRAPYSSPIFVPSLLSKVLGQRSLGMSRVFGFAFIWTNLIPDLALHQNCKAFVRSIISYTLGLLLFWKLNQVSYSQ